MFAAEFTFKPDEQVRRSLSEVFTQTEQIQIIREFAERGLERRRRHCRYLLSHLDSLLQRQQGSCMGVSKCLANEAY